MSYRSRHARNGWRKARLKGLKARKSGNYSSLIDTRIVSDYMAKIWDAYNRLP